MNRARSKEKARKVVCINVERQEEKSHLHLLHIRVMMMKSNQVLERVCDIICDPIQTHTHVCIGLDERDHKQVFETR